MRTPTTSMSASAHRAMQLLSMMTVAVTASSCKDSSPAAPISTASAEDARSAYRATAFVLDISTRDGGMKVSQPLGDARSFSAARSPFAGDVAQQRSLSLLSAGVVDLVASNFAAGAIGAVAPGRILITFDLTVTNRLAGIRLVTSTFPVPPAGATGVQAFPLEMFAIQQSSTTGTFIFSQPTDGPVIASDDWNGAPHNFLNDNACNNSVTSDCFRYESFGAVEPLASSLPRKVGFLITPTVLQFRVNLILAADLLAASVVASDR